LDINKMNIEFVKQALAKIGNPNILVNMISKRVRQLNSSGSVSRPLVADASGLSAPDIALREIIEDKMSFEMPLSTEVLVGAPAGGGGKRRRKSAAA
jgi:DNA-directed RNA polymerase subunit omega